MRELTPAGQHGPAPISLETLELYEKNYNSKFDGFQKRLVLRANRIYLDGFYKKQSKELERQKREVDRKSKKKR